MSAPVGADDLHKLRASDMDNLRHMLGCETDRPRRSWGFRNYFVAGAADVESMERLVAVGWVANRGRRGDDVYYSATVEGCRAVGMTERAIAAMATR